MRLASKIFVAASLVIVVLVVVSALSLRAIARLVSVNSDITTRTLPAVRRATAVRDGMIALARLEARFLVLGDVRYAALWDERAARARDDLDRLADFLTTRREREVLRDVQVGFDEYRQTVDRERALLAGGDRRRALALAETEARRLSERVESNLDALMDATHGAVLRAQAEAARLEARTWAGVLLSLGAAVGLALLATAVIAARLTRSLHALSLATAAVAAGSFREPIRVEGHDEIADLARSFNAMAVRLREVDSLKESFLATVSHELRSPLTSMREAAHLLGEGVPGELNPKQARLVTIVGESCDRLLRLVNQLLELSRLRAGAPALERRAVDLDGVVARALEELRPQADEAGIALVRERVGHAFPCLGDEDHLVQVVVNLVANAIRFTPRGGRITARVIEAAGEVEIQVEDTGEGIPAAALPHIFEWYRQAHPQRGGTGLGLAIVRSIVDAHGGRVTVESQEGKGSRFTVLLPRWEGRA